MGWGLIGGFEPVHVPDELPLEETTATCPLDRASKLYLRVEFKMEYSIRADSKAESPLAPELLRPWMRTMLHVSPASSWYSVLAKEAIREQEKNVSVQSDPRDAQAILGAL